MGERNVSDSMHRSSQTSTNKCVGVVGGDAACMRAFIHQWAGHPASWMCPKGVPIIRLPDSGYNRDIVFLLSAGVHLTPWPGGPLIWLYPERGPSEPELAQMRLALGNFTDIGQPLVILLCLPQDVDRLAAEHDLDIIYKTLLWAVEPTVEIELEAVWMSDSQPGSLRQWLDCLR